MFLEQVLDRNPELIEIAFHLHQKGVIEPNTYLLDLDYIKENAAKLNQRAVNHDFNLYFITKQIGRNPLVAREIVDAGIEKAVAVDPWEARRLFENGIKIGNVGHLVQIPEGMVREILKMEPEIITVYSLDKAEKISKIAREMGIIQDIMLRILDKDGFHYKGQNGGFYLSQIREKVKVIKKLSNIRINGVTTFPCLLYNYEKKEIEVTPQFNAILKARKILKDEFMLDIEQINAPSVTAIKTIPFLKEKGATHGEPGHSLTGTTPAHAYEKLQEKPAYIYVSEVSHTIEDEIYVYGGGFYERSHLKGALIGDFENNKYYKGKELPAEMIDYYHILNKDNKEVNIGDTVLYSFRTQIFVTRANVAVVEGLHTGKTKLKGIYTSLGEKIKGEIRI